MPCTLALLEIRSSAGVLLLGFSVVLLLILVVSFRSRPIIFCQYLRTMTGIELKPHDVRNAFNQKGQDGVRDLFLELIIREDLQHGPLPIPEAAAEGKALEPDSEPVPEISSPS